MVIAKAQSASQAAGLCFSGQHPNTEGTIIDAVLLPQRPWVRQLPKTLIGIQEYQEIALVCRDRTSQGDPHADVSGERCSSNSTSPESPLRRSEPLGPPSPTAHAGRAWGASRGVFRKPRRLLVHEGHEETRRVRWIFTVDRGRVASTRVRVRRVPSAVEHEREPLAGDRPNLSRGA